ncbi:response regulator [Roseateles koreensis]|uniref:Response regulator transcription factor n=1 Tax=Roseateles koreensis TaxID=2987526 RepID=A0ABT5KT39_9BURK|nr:response regulator transcription factor [Roseateles koreensis]MDC8786079.1 response regulator transcription factor [Roseateles koreensis]
MIRLLVVDDHSLFRRGLTALLNQEDDLDVVGEAADGSEALRRAADLRPDVILLDNHMPGVRGVDLLPGLLEATPHSRILMLTVSEDEQDLTLALRGGALGYLLKTIDGVDLACAVRRAAQGQSVVSPEMTDKLVMAFKASAPPLAEAEPTEPRPDALAAGSELSPRQQDVLREIARGGSNKEIARNLGIAETTVKIHVQHIFAKLALSSRVQVAVWASERGLG